MNPMPRTTILYVDDEPLSLKYFERLVTPLAPVVVAGSVAQGSDVLARRGAEIAVLITDQRMPGGSGNELLRHARDHHPGIVRLLTTAYSDLGEAIEAINSGEIYRYITKPWDLNKLRADLKNALELAHLRDERDSLVREKMLLLLLDLLRGRVRDLALVCAGLAYRQHAAALHLFLEVAVRLRCDVPPPDWGAREHADLIQAEAERAIAIGQGLAGWFVQFERRRGAGASPLAVLAHALPEHAEVRDNGRCVMLRRYPLTALLEACTSEALAPQATAWLAWLLWHDRAVSVRLDAGTCEVRLEDRAVADVDLPGDWLADCLERMGRR